MIRHWLVVAVLIGALASAGCPEGADTRKPVESCGEIGQLCRLEGDKIGVCTVTQAEEFECVPQHSGVPTRRTDERRRGRGVE